MLAMPVPQEATRATSTIGTADAKGTLEDRLFGIVTEGCDGRGLRDRSLADNGLLSADINGQPDTPLHENISKRANQTVITELDLYNKCLRPHIIQIDD